MEATLPTEASMNRTLEYLDHNIEDLMTEEELGLVDEYVEHLEAIEDDKPIVPRCSTGQEG
jgi:hypothetical protein